MGVVSSALTCSASPPKLSSANSLLPCLAWLLSLSRSDTPLRLLFPTLLAMPSRYLLLLLLAWIPTRLTRPRSSRTSSRTLPPLRWRLLQVVLLLRLLPLLLLLLLSRRRLMPSRVVWICSVAEMEVITKRAAQLLNALVNVPVVSLYVRIMLSL